MNVKRFLGKLSRASDVIGLKAKTSYSQVGEDLVVDYLFTSLGIKDITYLEIGTNQPVLCNNTYLFYKTGFRGVCVEPDTEMIELIKTKRPGDKILNVGIGLTDQSEATFYLFPGLLNGWSTFSESEAKIRQEESGISYRQLQVPLKSINSILEEYFHSCPNFISVDVEGLDLAILQSMDFIRFRPDVICVETISFSTNNSERKQEDISAFMHSKGYITYADTHVNTIFCRSELFSRGK